MAKAEQVLSLEPQHELKFKGTGPAARRRLPRPPAPLRRQPFSVGRGRAPAAKMSFSAAAFPVPLLLLPPPPSSPFPPVPFPAPLGGSGQPAAPGLRGAAARCGGVPGLAPPWPRCGAEGGLRGSREGAGKAPVVPPGGGRTEPGASGKGKGDVEPAEAGAGARPRSPRSWGTPGRVRRGSAGLRATLGPLAPSLVAFKGVGVFSFYLRYRNAVRHLDTFLVNIPPAPNPIFPSSPKFEWVGAVAGIEIPVL